jgi:hypothetical protein
MNIGRAFYVIYAPMYFKMCLRRVLLILLSIPTIAFAQTDCKLRKDEDGIKVYTCSTDSSKFKSIKVECILNCSINKLESLLLDFDNYIQWQFNTTESKALKKISDTEFIYYSRIYAQWPVSERDMVVKIQTTRSSNQLLVSANSEKGILAEVKGLVRVPASRSQWIVTETTKDKLDVKYSIQIDPGGNVPAWIVNWVCANAPLQSFQAIKKRVEEKK